MVEVTKTYHAAVSRDGRFWLIRVRDIERSTQARHLRELDEMANDLISTMTGEAPEAFTVEYEIELPDAVREHLESARQLRKLAAHAQTQAAAESRAAARELHRMGLTVRDVGQALGMSYQRAQQLITEPALSTAESNRAALVGLIGHRQYREIMERLRLRAPEPTAGRRRSRVHA